MFQRFSSNKWYGHNMKVPCLLLRCCACANDADIKCVHTCSKTQCKLCVGRIKLVRNKKQIMVSS